MPLAFAASSVRARAASMYESVRDDQLLSGATVSATAG